MGAGTDRGEEMRTQGWILSRWREEGKESHSYCLEFREVHHNFFYKEVFS